MLDLSITRWLVVILSGLLIGVAKVGLPGTGILVVPLTALALGGKVANGFLLPMLALADILAIVYWRRHAQWGQLARLLPWTALGILIGAWFLEKTPESILSRAIGILILILLIGSWLRQRHVRDDQIPTHWAFAASTGILAGAVSMMAHAAGPVMIIYLLAMRFNKSQFMGTQAWFFWAVNLFKMPFSSRLGLITSASLLTNLALLPAIIAGGALGMFLIHRINQQTFNRVIQVLAVLAALKLCF